MIVVPCLQGSDEWHAARLGIPTASRFGDILTPGGKLSTSATKYACELVAERLLGHPIEVEASDFMQRGKSMEDEAVRWYSFQRDIDVTAVGFVLHDSRRFGCSPDRLVGDRGGLEIKTPSAKMHVFYLAEGLPKTFQPQVQGCLWITGRSWWDLVSYNPELPPALVRIHRDDDYIAALAEEVPAFADQVDEIQARIAAMTAAAKEVA